MSDKTIIKNGTVVTLGDRPQVIENGAVLVVGGVIEQVGRRDEVSCDGARIVDARGGVIMPGFINAHMHLYSTYACGISLKDAPPSNFAENLERLWWRLDKALTLEDVRYSALTPLVRCLRAGTTTIIDHHASPSAVSGSLEAIAQAAGEAGVRSCLCYELSDRDGPEIAKAGIEENVSFIKACRAEPNAMVSAMFGLHASMTIGQDTLEAAVEASKGLDCGFHIHTSESVFDPEDSLRNYGKRVVNRLADAGVLGDKSICVHCVHLDEREMEILRDTKTNVVHNPQSNMNNAVGRADIFKMLDMGILVGLGTDGMSSTMLDDVRCVNLLHKHHLGDPRVGFCEAGKLLLENNRRIAARYFDKPVGVLEPGAYGDVITIDYLPATPMTTDNFLGHLLFGIPSATVRNTVVDGKVRMHDGEIMGVDVAAVAERSRKLATSAWERF